MSRREIERLADLIGDRRSAVPFYVNTSRGVLDSLGDPAAIARLKDFGAIVVTDTCTYLSPMMDGVDGNIMTNSGKWAFYAPSNLGVGVMFGSLVDCVESAVLGQPVTIEVLRA